MKIAKESRFYFLSLYIIINFISIVFLLPFIWLIITSLKPRGQVFTNPLEWIPNPVMWSNYYQALFETSSFQFISLLNNTLFYTISSTFGIVISSAIVAYAFARLEFFGKKTLFWITISTMLLPGVVLLIPRYLLFHKFGWVGTYAPLIVPYFFGNAFNIFLLRQFMLTIPLELSDAAKIDGANEFQIFLKVILPLVKPALMVVAVFHFIYTWNDFLEPLIYLDEADEYPLVLGLSSFQTRHQVKWHLMLAASMAVTIPMIILFFVAQKQFIQGIATTGIKN